MFDQAIGGLTSAWGTGGGGSGSGPLSPGLFGAWAAGDLRSPAPPFELPLLSALAAWPAIVEHGSALAAAPETLGGFTQEPEVPGPARASGPEEADGPPWGALPPWFVVPTGVLPMPTSVPSAAGGGEWVSPGPRTHEPQVEIADGPGLAATYPIDTQPPSRNQRGAGSDTTLLARSAEGRRDALLAGERPGPTGEYRAEPNADAGVTTESGREHVAPPLAAAPEHALATHTAASEIACALIAFHANPSGTTVPASASSEGSSASLAGTLTGLPSRGTRAVPAPREVEASPLPETGPPAVVPPSGPGAPAPLPQYFSAGDSPYPGERAAADDLRARSWFSESARVLQLPRGWHPVARETAPRPPEVWNLELTAREIAVPDSGAAPLATPGRATVEPGKTPRTGMAVPISPVEPPVREAGRPGFAPDRAAWGASPEPAGPDRERSGAAAAGTPVPMEPPGEDAGPGWPPLRAIPPKDPESRRESSPFPERSGIVPPPVSPPAPFRPLAVVPTAVGGQEQAGRPPAGLPASPRPGSGVRLEGLRLRLADPAAGAVDIHVAERRGTIQVSVRSADAPLAADLRRELPPLIEMLDRSGFDIRSASVARDAAGSEATRHASGPVPPALSQAAAGENAHTGARDDQRPRRAPQRGWLQRPRTAGAEGFSLATDHSVREVTR